MFQVNQSEQVIKEDGKRNMTNVEKIEAGLAKARSAIHQAALWKNYTSVKEQEFVPRGAVYRNPYAFQQ